MVLGNRCTPLCGKTVCQFLVENSSRPLVEEERAGSGGPSDPNCCMKNSPEQMGVKAEQGQVSLSIIMALWFARKVKAALRCFYLEAAAWQSAPSASSRQ